MLKSEQPRIWFLVTDGHRAHVVVPDPTEGRFRTRLSLGIAEAPHYPPALPGEIPPGPLERFAADVADCLEQSAAESEFDDLVLVGPAHVIAEIRMALGGEALTRLAGMQTWEHAELDDDVALSAHLARRWPVPSGGSDMIGLRADDVGK